MLAAPGVANVDFVVPYCALLMDYPVRFASDLDYEPDGLSLVHHKTGVIQNNPVIQGCMRKATLMPGSGIANYT